MAEAELDEVSLAPGTGGIFEVRINSDLLWSRAEQGRFPDIKELKQLVELKNQNLAELQKQAQAKTAPSPEPAAPPVTPVKPVEAPIAAAPAPTPAGAGARVRNLRARIRTPRSAGRRARPR